MAMPMLGPRGGSFGHRLWVGLAVAIACAFLVLQLAAVHENARRAVDFVFDQQGPGLEVVAVGAGGPADAGGLRVGDRVLQIDNVGLEVGLDYDRLARDFKPGHPVLFRALRGTQPIDVTIVPGRPPAWGGVVINGLLTAACLVLAVVAARRLEDIRARLLCWLLLTVALILALPWETIGSVAVSTVEHCAYRLLVGAQMGVVLHLVSVIPIRRSWAVRWPRLIPGFHVFGWSLGIAAAMTYVAETVVAPGSFPSWLPHPDVLLLDIAMPLWAVAATAALAIYAVRGERHTGRAQAALILLGMVPWILEILLSVVIERGNPGALDLPLYEAGVVLFALATMVAIFRYQLFDITLVVRRSLVYTVVSAFAIGLLYGIVVWGGAFASRQWGVDSTMGWLPLAVAFVLGLAFGPLRQRLQRAIDRQVFPERSALRGQLIALARELPTLGQLPAMGRRLTSEVRRMFAASNASLLLADPQTGLLTTLVSKHAASKQTTEVPMFLAPGDSSLQRVAGDPRPRTIEQLGPVSDDLAARFKKLNAALLVPLLSHKNLVGLLVMGPRAEEPYTAEEKELLQLMAQHAAAVFENVRLYESATFESLTGLLRRESVLDLLAREIDRARRYRRPLSIAMIDIDHFKRVNDAFGHPAGDKVLQAVATEMASGLRSTDAVGRYGGEEFLILLPETSIDRAAIVAEDVRRRVAGLRIATAPGAESVSVRVSIGLASFDEIADVAEEPVDALVACADRALYRAKNAGRNRVESEVLDPDLVARARREAAVLRRRGGDGMKGSS